MMRRAWTIGYGALTLAALGGFASPAWADNPIIQHIYTADPAPLVHGDTVYLYTSHDEDVTVGGFFTMNDWRVFSSKDMLNWTDHGSPAGYQTFSWATGKAWAPHAIERDGKFYLYVPVSDAIGVAVSDSPTGPFVDAIGSPLVSNYQYIDPTVFIDGDGQAYLYFGNPSLWYVKLNKDMTSYSGGVQSVPMTTQSFGSRAGDAGRPTLYEEGPWFYKRDGTYYMMYAAGGIPEDIAYSTSSSPTGPWTYQGTIMPNQSGHAFTNHAGVIDFQGRSFFFYHTQELPGGGGFKRSVALEEFTYQASGKFPSIDKSKEGVTEAVQSLNPFERVEAETIAWEQGIEVEDCSQGGRNVGNIEAGDYIKVESVDFGTGALSFEASIASAGSGGTIELRLDAVDGALIGACEVPVTGGWQDWQTVSCDVSGAEGEHDLYLVFQGAGGFLFNVDYWKFVSVEPAPTGTGGQGPGAGLGGASTGGTLSPGDGVTAPPGDVAPGGEKPQGTPASTASRHSCVYSASSQSGGQWSFVAGLLCAVGALWRRRRGHLAR